MNNVKMNKKLEEYEYANKFGYKFGGTVILKGEISYIINTLSKEYNMIFKLFDHHYHNGLWSWVYGIYFKNDEDAIAFKLKFDNTIIKDMVDM